MTGGEAFRKASRLAVLPVVALLSWPALQYCRRIWPPRSGRWARATGSGASVSSARWRAEKRGPSQAVPL